MNVEENPYRSPETLDQQGPRHADRRHWLYWRWIPATLLLPYAGLCLMMAFAGAIFFDGMTEVLEGVNGLSGWRIQFWRTCTGWPAIAMHGGVAVFAAWAIWKAHWKATAFAIVAILVHWTLRTIAIDLLHT